MISSQRTATSRLHQFLKVESASGLIMLGAAVLALILANTTTAAWYHGFVEAPVGFSLGHWEMVKPLKQWVNDVLMVFFFLLIGMELKSEMVDGSLSDKKQILLPLLAALGGMAAPAGIFLLINYHIPHHWNGWAIPSATDIAFALSVFTLANKRLPPALKIFLLAIAIFDDLGAILIIAFFYSGTLALTPLLLAATTIAALLLLNRQRVMRIFPYILLGIALWFFLYHGGIHTTIAGVLVGMAIPLRNPNNPSHSPLHRCMRSLHPWVSFLILPIFAFTATGVNLHNLSLTALCESLTLGVAAGLFVGKQLGIFSATWLVVRSGAANLPPNTNWRQIYGVALLAGIGFTMSLFIGILAFDDTAMHEQIKLGVITGSLLSAMFGWLVLRRAVL